MIRKRINLGRRVSYTLASLWAALSILTHFNHGTTAILIAMTIAGGHIADQIGDAEQLLKERNEK